jgi:hypothetical protein
VLFPSAQPSVSHGRGFGDKKPMVLLS